MSVVELLSAAKKILGKLPRTEFSEHDYPLDRLMDLLSAPEHLFKPEMTVDEAGTSLAIDGFLISLKAEDAPCKINLDRPVTDEEYSVVFPNTIKKVARLTERIYLKAPAGQTSKVTLEVLKLA